LFQGNSAEKLTEIDFTIEDVKNVLNKLREDKAAGADELIPRVLSRIKDELAYPLYRMEEILKEGIVLKTGKERTLRLSSKKATCQRQKTTVRQLDQSDLQIV